MEITAIVKNSSRHHEALVRAGDTAQTVAIAPKAQGCGSAVSGGELLVLALATCYCNDLYREAQRLGIDLRGVEVEASARFEGAGLAANHIRYRARLDTTATPPQIERLLREADAVAEVHNTLRVGTPVDLILTPSP